MPDLVEQMYCSQQIFIPPNLPSILKKYAKAAIRTQPGDLLTWSSAYFRALAEGIPPPAKDRIEYPPFDSPSGLTPGFLKVLVNQIGKREVVSKDVLVERWKGVCLNSKALQDLLDVGMFGDEVHWLEFFAICVGTMEPTLTRTMIHICELLTDEPEGGRAAIPVSLFINLYKYLAKLDCGPVNTLEEYELMKRADSETNCIADVLTPQEEETRSEVPNIDWDTAIEKEPSRAGSAAKIERVESGEDTAGEDEGIGEDIGGSDKDMTDGDSVKDGGSAVAEGKTEDQPSDPEMMRAEPIADLETVENGENYVSAELVEEKESLGDGGSLIETRQEDLEGEKQDMTEEKVVADTETIEAANPVEESPSEDKEEGAPKILKDDPVETVALDGEAADDPVETGVHDGGADDDTVETEALDVGAGDDTVKTEALDGEAADGTVETGAHDDGAHNDTAETEALDVGAGDNPAKTDALDGEAADDTVGTGAHDGGAEDDTVETEALEVGASDDPAHTDALDGEAADDTVETGAHDDRADDDTVETEALDIGAGDDPAHTDALDGEAADETVETGAHDGGADNGTVDTEALDVGAGDDPAQADALDGEAADDTVETGAHDGGVHDDTVETEALDVGAGGDPAQADALNDESTDSPEPELAIETLGPETLSATAEEEVPPIKEEEGVIDVDNSEGLTVDSKLETGESQDGDETRPPTVVENPLNDNPDAQDENTNDEPADDTKDIKEPFTDEEIDPVTIDAAPLEEEGQTNHPEGEHQESESEQKENGNDAEEDSQETAINLKGTEPTLDLGLAYIVDDDGTLSAAPRPDSGNEALKERDSEKTIDTNPSDDGMMVWPDIKLQEKEDTVEEPMIEKEVLSEDGIEVFTDVETQMAQEQLTMVPEQPQDEAQPEASEQEDNIFAPHIDSFTDLLEAESAPAEEVSPEELAAAMEGSVLEEATSSVTEVIEAAKASTEIEEGSDFQAAAVEMSELQEPTVAAQQKREIPPARKEVEIDSLVKKDSEMMLLPTPVTSDVMLYMENECDKTGFKITPTQQLTNKMSMVDVQVAVPMDETIEEVYEQHRYPKWMHIPGIGPIVPDHIIEEAEKYFTKVSELQEGMVMPRNIRHFHCPALELIPDCPDETR